MNRFLPIFLAMVMLAGAREAHALSFGIQTSGKTAGSRVQEFQTARKAYAQLKTQGADDATLVIQGRVVLDAMLNVFEAALDSHEKRFDELNANGATDEQAYVAHKARIEAARTWISEQRDLVKSSETREELRNRATAFSNEWKAFRKDAMIARASILIARAETFLQKAEAMQSKLDSVQTRLGELGVAADLLSGARAIMDAHVADARFALQEAQTRAETLKNGAAADSDASYQAVLVSLKRFRSSLSLARETLGTFRTLARTLVP